MARRNTFKIASLFDTNIANSSPLAAICVSTLDILILISHYPESIVDSLSIGKNFQESRIFNPDIS
jgi:hypothetical protein